MPTIGSMTVSVDAVATKANAVFKDVAVTAGNVGASLKKLGQMEVGRGDTGDLLGQSVRMLRDQFTAMIDDTQTLAKEAEKAGQSIGEFTNGAFTEDDVRKANEFTAAIDELNRVWPEARKELLIDISPQVVDSIKLLIEWASKASGVIGGIQERIKPLGEAAGNLSTNRFARPIFERVERYTGISPTAVLDFNAARVGSHPTQAERIAKHDRAEEIELSKRRNFLLEYNAGQAAGPPIQLIEAD